MWKKLPRATRALCIALASLFMQGCSAYYMGDCGEDEDLQDPDNFYDGAICVDGRAACPGGEDFCMSLQTVAGVHRIVPSCDGPCMECPGGRGACVFNDYDQDTYSFVCVEKVSDCWSNSGYLELRSYKDDCPTMNPNCL